MPLNIPAGRAGGGGDRRVLDMMGQVYSEVQEQGDRLKRVEQLLARLEQSIDRIERGLRA